MTLMYYYKLADDNIHIEAYCRDKGHAKKSGFNLTTNEEIIMQGDGSGYVLASQYVAPPTDNSYVMTMEERMEATEEAILDIYSMLGSDL